MMRLFVGGFVALILAMGISGCGGGSGIEEGIPPNAGYTPPKEQPTMKLVPRSEIEAKKKAAQESPPK